MGNGTDIPRSSHPDATGGSRQMPSSVLSGDRNDGDGCSGSLFGGPQRGDRNLSCTTVVEVNVVNLPPSRLSRHRCFRLALSPADSFFFRASRSMLRNCPTRSAS